MEQETNKNSGIKADVTISGRHLSGDETVEALQSFDMVCTSIRFASNTRITFINI
jgi:hypothetical protein